MRLNKEYVFIIDLLDNWKLYSERLFESDVEKLNALYTAFDSLNKKEKEFLTVLHYTNNAAQKHLNKNYETFYLDILEKIKKSIVKFINDEEKKKKKKEKQLSEELTNEAKAHLTQLRCLTGPFLEQWRYRIETEQKLNKLQNVKHIYVLRERYILNKFWKEISLNLGCDIQKASRIHDEALKEFGKVLRQELRKKLDE